MLSQGRKAGQPNIEDWAAGHLIVRCHPDHRAATEFNVTTVSQRFRPIYQDGRVVPTLYGSESFAGALSETVLHDVPVRAQAKRVSQRTLLRWRRSTLAPSRALHLAQLHGHGFHALGVSRAVLIESGPSGYARTAAVAQDLYQGDERLDGLVWRSRQFDDALAVVLWATRVGPGDLEVVEERTLIGVGFAFHEAQLLLARARIVITP
ncbi:MAG: RES family NAD+ phosphorylase [Candidatus Dormibacteria bacterium]